MKFPQDIAIQISEMKNLESIKKYGCCAFVTLWCLGIEPDNAESILLLEDAINSKVLKSDCTVIWDKFIQWITGRTASVDFVDITTIKGIKERTPVKYVYGKYEHWVGVENGMIKFNPINDSNCVKNGKPTTKRVIKIKGLVK